MAVANVTLTDTFDQWRIKTNQLISVYDQTNELALRAYNVSNSVANSAANIAVELVYGNTTIMNTIYRNANTITYDWIGNNDITTIKNRSNIAVNTANYVYQLANGISNTSNYVYQVSNSVYNVSNVVYASSNGVANVSNLVYAFGNTVFGASNGVSNSVNTVFIRANDYTNTVNSIYVVSNNTVNSFNSLMVTVNTYSNTVNTVYASQNNVTNTVNGIFATSNNTSNSVTAAYITVNTYSNTVNSFFATINNSANISNTVFAASNGVSNVSNLVYSFGNTVFGASNGVSNSVNSVFNTVNNYTNTVNTIYVTTNNYNNTVNSIYVTSNNLGNTVNNIYVTSNNLGNTVNNIYVVSNNVSNTANYTFVVSNNSANVSNVVYARSNDQSNLVNSMFVTVNNSANSVTASYISTNNSANAVNTFYVTTNNVSNVSNLVYSFGNTVFGASNGVSNSINAVFNTVNNYTNTVNNIYVVSNNLGNTVNSIYVVSNNTVNTVNVIYVKANDSSNVANVAYLYSNNAYNIANNVQLNVANIVANTLASNTQIVEMINATANLVTYNYLSTTDFSAAYVRANLSYQAANQSYNIANIAYDQSNTAYNVAVNAASFMYANGVANSANAYAVTVGAAANITHWIYANGVANSANAYAVTVGASGNTAAYIFANGTANSANAYAVTVGSAGNTSAYTFANNRANSANSYAVTIGAASNTWSNTRLSNVIATSGRTTVTWSTTNSYTNATIDLATTSVTASTYGSANNIPVFTVDSYGRLTYAANVAVQGMDYPFANGVANSANLYGMAYANGIGNSVNSSASSLYYLKTGGTITGDVAITGNLTISGLTTYANTQSLNVGDNLIVLNADLPSSVAPIENSGIEVNRGNKRANAQLLWVEAANAWGFTDNSSNIITTYIASNTLVEVGAIASSNWANTKTSNVIGTARVTAVYSTTGGYNNVTVDLSTTGVTATNYGGATQIPVFTVDSYGRLTYAANVAVQGMDYPFANGVANAANSNAATKVASVTGTAGQIFSSGGTTPTLNLITTAVTSSTYGGATQIPVFTVDTFGRLTYASNVTVQGMDYPFANGVANSANLYGMAYANGVANSANLYGMAYANGVANSANLYGMAYANGVANSANIYGMTYGNSSFGTIANTASAFRHANSAYDKANGAAQLSFVNVLANGTNLVADSNTDTLTITPTSPISIVGDAGTDTVTIGLQTSGVSATTYGGTTQIPVYTVDSFGRITYSANVSFSAGGTTIGSESSSASTFYPVFTSTTSGTLATANVDTVDLTYVPATGTLSALAFNSLSDITLKDNITPIDNSLDVLKSLNGVSFDWKDSGSKSYGVVAQDVERIVPELVGKINRGKTVNYDGIIAFLIEAIKEMSEKIDKLEKKQ